MVRASTEPDQLAPPRSAGLAPDGSKIRRLAVAASRMFMWMNPDGTDREPDVRLRIDGVPARLGFPTVANRVRVGEREHDHDGHRMGRTWWSREAGRNRLAGPTATGCAFSNGSTRGHQSLTTPLPGGTGTGRSRPPDPGRPDWQPLPYTGYARPKGATPVPRLARGRLQKCTAPEPPARPGARLPSCAPPVQESDWLTTGTADSNGQATRVRRLACASSLSWATQRRPPTRPTWRRR